MRGEWPNGVHHWRRASNAPYLGKTESRRPVHVSGWPLCPWEYYDYCPLRRYQNLTEAARNKQRLAMLIADNMGNVNTITLRDTRDSVPSINAFVVRFFKVRFSNFDRPRLVDRERTRTGAVQVLRQLLTATCEQERW